jgi:type II secretory pathway component PulF
VARRKTNRRKRQSLDLMSALEALRTALPYWYELCQAHFAEVEEVRQAKECIRMIEADNSVLPDSTNDAINARLRSAQQRVKRGIKTAKAYSKVVKIIEVTVPMVAAAAEQADMDTGPLLLFAADLDPRYWEQARALVDQLSIMHHEENRTIKRPPRQAAADLPAPKKKTSARTKNSSAD